MLESQPMRGLRSWPNGPGTGPRGSQGFGGLRETSAASVLPGSWKLTLCAVCEGAWGRRSWQRSRLGEEVGGSEKVL